MVNTIVYTVIDMLDVFINDTLGNVISYVCLLGTILALFFLFRRGTGW